MRTLTDLHLAGKRPLTRRPELELREVELSEPVGRWPRGTLGVIVDAFEDDTTIEISDAGSETMDLITLPYGRFALLEPASQEQLSLDA